jgi:hypothetical protein
MKNGHEIFEKMKNVKYFLIALVAVAALGVGFSSCDDSYITTPKEDAVRLAKKYQESLTAMKNGNMHNANNLQKEIEKNLRKMSELYVERGGSLASHEFLDLFNEEMDRVNKTNR